MMLLFIFFLISFEENVVFSIVGWFNVVGVILWLNSVVFCIVVLMVLVIFLSVFGILNVILVIRFWFLK